MPDRTDVAIIGAGPYGLSIAAHLAALRVPFRIFGRPMENWQNMPRGMQLKSDGFASTLYDPQRVLTLGKYCRERGLGYADLGLPVSSAVFCEYGQAFQRRLVPDLDRRLVVRTVRNGAGFHLALEDGTTVQAKRVVVATGITNYAWLPPVLSGLPADKVTHSSAHAEPARFSGLDVVVVGGGSSAIDLSALMHEAGATVRMVTRRAALPIHSRMRLPRPLGDRIRSPLSVLGPGWRSCFFTRCPPIVHRMAAERRIKWVKTEFGASAGWFMAERIKPVSILYRQSPVGAEVVGGKVRLVVADLEGQETTLDCDHLVVATGYRPNVARMTFLDAELQRSIVSLENAPVVSLKFESSVADLYFVGPPVANSFGPLMRFAAGAGFAAPRIARHLAATAGRRPATAASKDETVFGIGARA